jgi:CRISPR system Cascade subunit CasE
MFLNRIHLDLSCKEARRDLADPYQLHSTLCRAFSKPDIKCPEGEFLWRIEPETDSAGYPRILVQSRSVPDWTSINVQGWLANADPAIDLKDRLNIDSIMVGQQFRFRLRANPCVTKNGKRLGLLQQEEQIKWLVRKGLQHGFSLPQLASFDPKENLHKLIEVRISQEQMLQGHRQYGNPVRIFSVLYDGKLSVVDTEKFRNVLQSGIGHGKVLGLGLLSVVPIGG